jgi:hypothetical protein
MGRLLAAGVFGFSITVPVHAAFIITPGFDSTITNDPNSAAIISTINQAINTYENVIANNITVKIYFQEGGGLGESEYFIYNGSYSNFYNGLVANNSNSAAVAALNANGGNANTNGGVNPVTGTANLSMKSADMRALGINQAANSVPTAVSGSSLPTDCVFGSGSNAYDGIVSLNTAITFPPQGTTNYSLLSTVEHEIDEVLGLGSALENCNPSDPNATAACKAAGNWNASNGTIRANTPAPEDLYRRNAAVGGSRTLGTNCHSATSAYFSYGPSSGMIAQFNNVCNGADFGDWASGPNPRVQDAFGTPGASPTLSLAEYDALSAIGYDEAPEPATFG